MTLGFQEQQTNTTLAGAPEGALDPHRQELERGERFAFGDNWAQFLRVLDEDRILAAERGLKEMLRVDDLEGKRFLDVGSGSGLSSRAARRLGATVHSFDYDPQSVACTLELRRRFFGADDGWTIERGSVLDADYLRSLGRFDIVYSWGVLHHTGAMWPAVDNLIAITHPGDQLFIALYNDQGAWSNRWKKIKRFYCSGPVGRSLVLGTFVPATVLRNLAADIVWMRNPIARYREYQQFRGMSVVHDWKDWLGGYPFEVAKPEEVFEHMQARGFDLRRLRTCGGSVGCNEFVFERVR